MRGPGKIAQSCNWCLEEARRGGSPACSTGPQQQGLMKQATEPPRTTRSMTAHVFPSQLLSCRSGSEELLAAGPGAPVDERHLKKDMIKGSGSPIIKAGYFGTDQYEGKKRGFWGIRGGRKLFFPGTMAWVFRAQGLAAPSRGWRGLSAKNCPVVGPDRVRFAGLLALSVGKGSRSRWVPSGCHTARALGNPLSMVRARCYSEPESRWGRLMRGSYKSEGASEGRTTARWARKHGPRTAIWSFLPASRSVGSSLPLGYIPLKKGMQPRTALGTNFSATGPLDPLERAGGFS